MTDRLAAPFVAARTPSLRKLISIAGLLALSSACGGDGPVAPTVLSGPPASAAVSMARAASARGPAECVSDSKLIGRIALTTGEEQGTWWHLTREGFDAAGITDYRAFIEAAFGQSFASEAAAIRFLVEQVYAEDTNGNGYVCAYRIRGTHTSVGDPNFAFYYFLVRDDKHAGK